MSTVKKVLLLGNYQAGKTTIASVFTGVAREKVHTPGVFFSYLCASKFIASWQATVELQGLPESFGRGPISRSSNVTIAAAHAFVIVLRADDPVEILKQYWAKITREGKQNCPVLVLGRKQSADSVKREAGRIGAEYMEFDPDLLKLKEQPGTLGASSRVLAVMRLSQALITLAFGSISPRRPTIANQPILATPTNYHPSSAFITPSEPAVVLRPADDASSLSRTINPKIFQNPLDHFVPSHYVPPYNTNSMPYDPRAPTPYISAPPVRYNKRPRESSANYPPVPSKRPYAPASAPHLPLDVSSAPHLPLPFPPASLPDKPVAPVIGLHMLTNTLSKVKHSVATIRQESVHSAEVAAVGS